MNQWEEPTNEEPDSLDTILTMLLLIAVVCLSAFMLGLIYSLAQPWVNELITWLSK